MPGSPPPTLTPVPAEIPLVPEPARTLLADEQALVAETARLLAALGTPSAPLADLADRLAAPFLVVVAGEFNAGKSTVLNTLLGDTILEEGPVPTTDKITVLRYGDHQEAHRRGDHVVDVQAPSPLLRALTLVDTPGTNSIVLEHERLTAEFVPRADLVLFITSYDRPLSESERKFLVFLRQVWGKRLVFVLNKADLAGAPGDADAEAQLQQVMAHVQRAAEAVTGTEPRVFPVAARLALRAKKDAGSPAALDPDALRRDPRWEASRFGPFEAFLTDALTETDRLALKLAGPLDAVRTHLGDARARVAERRALLDADRQTLGGLDERFAHEEATLRTARDRALDGIDNEILEMERRGTQFLDDAIRISRIRLLKDRDAFKTAFAEQVGSGADRRIEERAAEAVDELLRASLTLWNEAYTRLAERQKDGKGLAGAALTYDRDAALRSALKEAKLQRERYDIDAEARRILEAARSTAALFAGTQAAAVGLGALTTVLLSMSALDVTGGLIAAGALAAAGFWLLPRQRRKAKAEFRERVEALRTALREGLGRQLDEETDEQLGRVRALIAPLADATSAEAERLDDAAAQLDALAAETDRIGRAVEKAYGKPTL